MEKRELSKENPFRGGVLLILSEAKHREIFGRGSLSPSYGGGGCYVGSTDFYRRVCLAITNEFLKSGVVMTDKFGVAVYTYQAPDILIQALQSISAPGQFVVSSVNLNNEVEGSTIAAGYSADDLALNGAYTHYMSGAHQLIIFSDCLEEIDSKWRYLLAEASQMYDEIIIVNPDCLRTQKISQADLRQAKMIDDQDVRYEWSLSLVSEFVLPSEEEMLVKLGSIQDAKAWKRFQEEKHEQAERARKLVKAKEKLALLIGEVKLSLETENCLLEMLLRDRELWGATVFDSNTIALVSGRSEWGSSGGIGYYSQAVMIFQGQSETTEWCYRDRYDSRKDNWGLCIEKIGQIKTEQKGVKICFRVELLNKGKSRWTEFSFAFRTELSDATLLSTEDQIVFRNQIDEAISLLLKAKEDRWFGQPEMLMYSEVSRQLLPGESVYVKYQKPSLQQKVVLEHLGLATIVIVEQIDHRVSDPQLRYELYGLKFGHLEPIQLLEDHSYDRAEGNAMISVIDLNSREIKIRTREGTKQISW